MLLFKKKKRKKPVNIIKCRKCGNIFLENEIVEEGTKESIDDEDVWIDLCPYCNNFLE